jgi:hypothetical protein
MYGRSCEDEREAPDCWAWTAAAACLRREEAERERCSIISDMLRFFRMGFLWRKELDFEMRRLPMGEVEGMKGLPEPVWRGP